jgi:hypothetical protein
MSTVKFGSKKFGRFKWGQSNKFYIKESLFEYLPAFINKDSNFLNGLITALANIILEWQRAVSILQIYHLTGFKGIKYLIENWKIFVAGNLTDNEIQDLVKTVYKIHQDRGTEDGILADLKRASGDPNASIKYYDEYECGWWLERTFPDIANSGLISDSDKVSSYVDLDNMLYVKCYNNTGKSNSFLKKLLIREIIPVALNKTITFLQPSTLKFGRFKMGLKKFGQLIYPR